MANHVSGLNLRREPEDQEQKIGRLKKEFVRRFGGTSDSLRIFAAPGRVNLIGEHIDYCGGHVFPAAITLDTTIIARKRRDGVLRLRATDLTDEASLPLGDLEPGKKLRWGNYQFGVADELQKAGFQLAGADMLYHDTVPLGAGLSSSANDAAAHPGGRLDPASLIHLARLSQKAEHNYIGVNCGIMDQFASAMGKKDHAILLDCATLDYQYAPLLLGEYALVIANTMKKRGLGESKYNERVAETSLGLSLLRQRLPGLKNLCDMTAAELEENRSVLADPVILKRVRHVVEENERVLRACSALAVNDLINFAKLLNEAQASIRDLYEVTGFELDVMVAEACRVKGCIAARMTGAGFGGCTVNLVRADAVSGFIEETGRRYMKKTGLRPEFYVCATGDGAREITGF